MSSENCNQYSPNDESHNDESTTENVQNQEIKVCFICGCHTTLVINIREPRCGPNMIDVISEKFKMRPLNEDKFLCYSCNNWLVNWYSTRRMTDDGSHEDANQTTSSTMLASITANAHEQTITKTSDDIRQCESTELVIISDDEDDENVDVNNIIQTLRSRLKKYLYYPNKVKANESNEFEPHPPATVIELNDSTEMNRNCERCGRLIRRNLNRFRGRPFCRSCRFWIRRYGNCSNRLKIDTNHLKHSKFQSASISSSNDTLIRNNHHNIFEKLQQLGTSICYEHERKGQSMHQHMTSIPHDIDTTMPSKHPTNAWKRPTNESNEILMTFNTVVTEVFPIEKLYNNYYDRQNDQITHNDHVTGKLNIQDILRNVPKSLTISIA